MQLVELWNLWCVFIDISYICLDYEIINSVDICMFFPPFNFFYVHEYFQFKISKLSSLFLLSMCWLLSPWRFISIEINILGSFYVEINVKSLQCSKTKLIMQFGLQVEVVSVNLFYLIYCNKLYILIYLLILNSQSSKVLLNVKTEIVYWKNIFKYIQQFHVVFGTYDVKLNKNYYKSTYT